MQHKIRINDLARELEVKSKSILDVLPKVGVTEKKTHSSSIEEDEAERVKKYFAEQAPSGSRSSRSSAAAADEFKPKIDLSHISKPGDVLKAITQRAAQPAAPPRPATPPSQATPAAARPAVAPPSAVPPRPPAPASPPAVASTPPAAPLEPPKPAPRFITPQSVARPPAAIVIPPKPPAPPAAQQIHAPSVSEAAKPSEATIDNQVAVLEEPETELAVPEATAPSPPSPSNLMLQHRSPQLLRRRLIVCRRRVLELRLRRRRRRADCDRLCREFRRVQVSRNSPASAAPAHIPRRGD